MYINKLQAHTINCWLTIGRVQHTSSMHNGLTNSDEDFFMYFIIPSTIDLYKLFQKNKFAL